MRPAGRRDKREGRTAGALEAGSPARPPRWAERGRRRRPLPEEHACGGRVARKARGRDRGPPLWLRTCLPRPPLGLRLGTPDGKGGTLGASSHTHLQVAEPPGAWPQISNSDRRCSSPASTRTNQRATQSQKPEAREVEKRGLGEEKRSRKGKGRPPSQPSLPRCARRVGTTASLQNA